MEPSPESVGRSLARLRGFLERTQAGDGTWPVPYTGPMFLLPLYVISAYICRRPLADAERRGMAHRLYDARLPDASIGIHSESTRGTMFTTVISYVALRMLGEDPGDERVAAMRGWILRHGGAIGSAAWGKTILCLLNLFDYAGTTPILPELYLLPRWFPFHPSRISAWVRTIYLPMSYFYGARAAIPVDDLIRALREEIFDRPYETIRFARDGARLHEADAIVPESLPLRLAVRAIRAAERLLPGFVRRRALARAYERVVYEDENSEYIRQAPVNALYDTLVHHFEGRTDRVARSWQVLPRYLWAEGDQVDMQGYTSCKLWDTAMILSALHEAPDRDGTRALAERAYRYVRENQITEELVDPLRHDRWFRKGGWPFGEKRNGWPIPDCSAEGLQASLLYESEVAEPVTEEALEDAVRYLLVNQNRDGGWSSCDPERGGRWMELFNASHLFLDIMVDHSFPECTSSAIRGLRLARDRFPGALAAEIDRAIGRAVRWLLRAQRADGSWEAGWGVCFSYATSFALDALIEAGLPPENAAIARGCRFLLERQLPDGGWGERPESCVERRYVSTAEGLIEATALVVGALVAAGHGSGDAVRRGVSFLLRRQMESGDWPPGPMCGQFYRTVLIRCENYRRAFPAAALGRYLRHLEAAGEIPRDAGIS